MPRRPPDPVGGERAAAARLIELGRVAASYGVHGWLAVRGEVEPLRAVREWSIAGVVHAVEGTRLHSGRLLAKLAGIDSREQARALRGKEISVPRESLPEPAAGIFYWADLTGLEVVTVDGQGIGMVAGMFSNGAHDVMQVRSNERERLVPFVPAVVKRVDLQARRIEVDWGADW